ncbi:MAG: hypothetical protein KBT57_10975, partial [bacterium]|nr:hypothetical protein [Candidatus Limimorpha equi]
LNSKANATFADGKSNMDFISRNKGLFQSSHPIEKVSFNQRTKIHIFSDKCAEFFIKQNSDTKVFLFKLDTKSYHIYQQCCINNLNSASFRYFGCKSGDIFSIHMEKT